VVYQDVDELWEVIPEFPTYSISSLGRVYNQRRDVMMKTSHTLDGNLKISLSHDTGFSRSTRSVALLVAEAFVARPDNLCDQVVILDGNFDNVAAYNLVWRPRWFAWKYARQLKTRQPIHYHNLVVRNLSTGYEHGSIVLAGKMEGLLFSDIWRSTYSGMYVYPLGFQYEVLKRV
jgi:hypothetical protein